MTFIIKPKRGSGTPTPLDVETNEFVVDSTNRRFFTRQGLSVVELGNNPQELDVDDINIDNNTISVTTADTDLNLTPNGTGVVNVNGDLSFDGGYGSVAPVFGVRAWCNYNGETNTIRASGNISTVAVVGAGRYRFHFATPMPDSNFSSHVTIGQNTYDLDNVYNDIIPKQGPMNANYTAFNLEGTGSEYRDWEYCNMIVVR